MPKPLLSRKSLVLAEVEGTYNVAETLDATTDAFLVSNPRYNPDVTRLTRQFDRATLSPLAGITGRKLARMTFSTEMRGNGRAQSGSLADSPRMVRLFRACGYSVTAYSSAQAGPVVSVGDHAFPVTWANGGTVDTDVLIPYQITVVQAGASGTATVRVDSPVPGESSAAQSLTSGDALTVGTTGLTVTPTFSDDVVAGQSWFVVAKPSGIELEPVSDGFESITMSMYKDGVLHSMPGARGTFSITAQAGQLPSIEWTFTGQYVAPTDTPFPVAVYETTKPSAFELAQLSVDGYPAVVDSLTYTQSNTVEPRSDANAPDGYDGVNITGREPTLGIDPEATLVADHDFWGKMADARQMPFTCRFGNKVGNTVFLLCPSTQYTGLTYADRTNNLTYDASMMLSGLAGDDEAIFFFA